MGNNLVYTATIALIDSIKSKIISPIIGFLTAIAVIAFVYGMVEFVANLDNESKREDGKRHMGWGLLGLVIVVSASGIMKVICETLSCGLI